MTSALAETLGHRERGAPPAGSQRFRESRARRVKRRDEAEGQTRHHGQGRGEGEHAPIDLDVRQARRIRRQDSLQRLKPLHGDHQPEQLRPRTPGRRFRSAIAVRFAVVRRRAHIER